jgi:hypothetical protein
MTKAREGQPTIEPRRGNKGTAKPDGRTPLLALTDHVKTPLLNALRLGNSLKTSCKFVGVGLNEDTVWSWLAKGRLALEKPAGERTRNQKLYANFVGEFEKASVEANVRAQSQLHTIMTHPMVDEAGQRIDVTPEQQRVIVLAVDKHLSHRDPDYSDKQQIELTGASGSPLIDFDAIWERAQVILARQDDDGAAVEDE